MDVTSKVKSKYYTVNEVADLLKLHWQTVLDLIKRGEISAIKLGKSYRIDEDALGLFISSRTVSVSSFPIIARERIDEMVNEGDFDDKRLIVLSAAFFPATDVLNLFSNRGDERNMVSLIEEPPVFRRSGWDLRTLDKATPVLGDYLEVLGGKVKKLRVYRDGQIVVGGLADKSFLGWAMEKYDKDDVNAINGMAVVEFISNFVVFVGKAMDRMDINPDQIFFNTTIVNPRKNKLTNIFKFNSWPFPETSGSSIRFARKDRLVIHDMKNDFNARNIATQLWSEYGYVFGIRNEELPYLGSDGTLDFKNFKNTR